MTPKTRTRAAPAGKPTDALAPNRVNAAATQDWMPRRIDTPRSAFESMDAMDPELAALAAIAEELSSSATIADLSIEAYGSQWRMFCTWASRYGLEPMPAAETTILLYVAQLTIAGTGISKLTQAMAAIAYQHERSGWESPTRRANVTSSIAGAKRTLAKAGTPVVRAHPLSVADLLTMVEALPDLPLRPGLADLNKVRISSVLLSGWHTGRRLDELARADVDWTQPQADGTTRFVTPSQKGRPAGFANSLYPTTDLRVCPVNAHRRWIAASAPFRHGTDRLYGQPSISACGELIITDRIAIKTAQMLQRGRPQGDDRFQTDADYEAFCRSRGVNAGTGELAYLLTAWMRFAGITPLRPDRRLSSHSNRRGLVTALRAAGVDLQVIADHVGWSDLDMPAIYSDFMPTTSPLSALLLS